MTVIPEFATALESFQKFLGDNSLPAPVVWVFRDDTFFPTHDTLIVQSKVGRDNAMLAAKVFEEGRRKGLVQIIALGRDQSRSFATIWFPRLAEDEVQGWNVGLKLGIRQPCPLAKTAGRVAWFLLQWNPAFRRYQRTYAFIGSRAWAAA